MQRKITAWVMVALCIALLVFPTPSARAAVQGSYVRVNLQSMGTPSTVSFQVNGNYGIDGRNDIVMTSGGDYTVSISGGSITLSGANMSGAVSLGNSVTVRSYDTSDGNIGYVFMRNANRSYRGDMTFSSVGGGMQVINRVYMEDYVCGVVRGELSNEFPMEALKAQAVAARTYAYRDIKPSSTWDIGDGTADQVYLGYRSADTNIARAVEETRGQLLYHGSTVVRPYYGASNGGQVETVKNRWPTRPDELYSTMKDDPYDLANPSSKVTSIMVPKEGASSNQQFNNLLLSKMGGGSLRGVSKITLSSPRQQGAGVGASRYWLSMTFELIMGEGGYTGGYNEGGVTNPAWGGSDGMLGGSGPIMALSEDGILGGGVGSGGGGGATSITGSIQTGAGSVSYGGWYTGGVQTVTLNTQSDLIGVFSPSDKLSFFTITETSSAFIIEARRYGHGVGMSQRGAQQMGKNGIAYRDILSFYYVGTSIVDAGFSREGGGNPNGGVGGVIVTPIPTATVDPWAAVTPAPNGSLGSGTVSASSLNVRATASNAGARVGSLARGNAVAIVGESGDFYQIQYGSGVGFVAKAYIIAQSTGGTVPATAPPQTANAGTVKLSTASSTLNVRSGPTTSSSLVGKLSSNARVQILGISGSWSQVSATGLSGSGYVMTQYIVMDAVSVTPVPSTPTPVPTVAPITPVPTPDFSSGSGILGGPTPSPTPVPVTPAPTQVVSNVTPPPAANAVGIIKANGQVNMRAEPNTTAATVARLGNNLSTTVLGKSGDWYKVTVQNITGWVKNEYITVSGAVNDIAAGGGTTGGTSAGTAYIVLQSAAGSLNMRAEPNTTSAVAGWLKHGDVVTVGVTSGEWTAVTATQSGKSGYVKSHYISANSGGTAAPAPTTGQTRYVKTNGGTLSIRSGPGTTYAKVGTVTNGEQVTIGDVSGQWTAVTVGGSKGFVMTQYLATTQTAGTGSTSSAKGKTTGNVHLRDTASAAGKSLGTLAKGTEVTVLEKGKTYTKVEAGGKTGYVSNAYLQYS